jgi:Domain of unknown function (DUF397)
MNALSFSNGNCVEVASLPGGTIGVRHSREPEGPVLKFTQAEWQAGPRCRDRPGPSSHG